jgi:putative SOS response-associated peptidase YedK
MCNLYTNRSSAAEVARIFGVELPNIAAFNVGEEVYPGYPGMVVREKEGARHLQAMTWGFPLRLKTMKPTSKPKAVNNARDDKLTTSMWRPSFEKRRCLIPVTQWAEAEGPSGKMTRTWYSLHGVDLFAVAGIWRWSEEWGDVYSMVMVDGCLQMSDVHDRMPVILRPDNHERWLHGTFEEALGLVRTCDDTLVVDRTVDPWFKARQTRAAGPLL